MIRHFPSRPLPSGHEQHHEQLEDVWLAEHNLCRPWNSDAQWHTLVGAAQDALQNAGPDSEAFQALCADIVTEANGGSTPPDFGEARHMQKTWARLADAPFLRQKGTQFDSGGGWRGSIATASSSPLVVRCTCSCCSMGVAKRWWRTLQETPLFRPVSNLPSMTNGALQPKDTKVPQKVSVKASSKDEMMYLRGAAKNVAHMACCILSSSRMHRFATMISVVVAPVRKAFGRMNEQRKTMSGAEDWLLMICADGYAKTADEVIGAVGGMGHLQSLGFPPAGLVYQVGVYGWESAEDKVIAGAMLKLSVSVLSHQKLSSTFHSVQPPLCA